MLQIGIQQLFTGIHLLPFWNNQSTMQFVHVCKIDNGSSNPTAATVTKYITITEYLKWSVNVHGHKLNAGKCKALWNVHDMITTKPALSTLIRQIDSLIVCPGNPDSHFLALADARIFHSPSKGAVALIDSLLVSNNRCDACKQYRCNLRALHSQWLRQKKKKKQPCLNIKSY